MLKIRNFDYSEVLLSIIDLFVALFWVFQEVNSIIMISKRFIRKIKPFEWVVCCHNLDSDQI